jgi:signal transduction histidine kinase
VVEDDGVGFDLAAARAAGGRGLANMTARAERLGGRLEIDSRPGVGTRIELEVPLAAPRGSSAGGGRP